ncbi:MAG: hypothetical protein MRY83_14980 [Flavobacteriales bacterium]|nr:hypothetical protein [Flavobacteriales bacterium]
MQIEKEQVSNLSFPKKEVIFSPLERIKRMRDLIRAAKLGNAMKRKVKIFFEDIEGMKFVETTIWATTERNIALKSGVIIPIHRIHAVHE